MRLLIVRHGETEDNLAGIMQGHQPGILTERGRKQAQALGARLKGERIDAAYCSDLTRAVDTVQAIAQFHPNLSIDYSTEIRERSLGIYEGKHGQLYYEDFAKSGVPRAEFKPERGESMLEVQQRTDLFLDRIYRHPSDHTVLICTHGGVVVTMMATLAKTTIEEMLLHSIKNTSISTVEIDGETFRVTEFNSITHLVALDAENSK